MKINVLQVERATFKKWTWWSNWVDVAVFNHSYHGYLLQMRINRFNRKSFRTAGFNNLDSSVYASVEQVGDLTPMPGAELQHAINSPNGKE